MPPKKGKKFIVTSSQVVTNCDAADQSEKNASANKTGASPFDQGNDSPS